MMIKEQIIDQIKKKRSFLCVGLDSDIDRIPLFLKNEKDPIFEFNRRIIDATKDFCVAYKPNLAFYEAMGPKGWEALEKTMAYIPENIFTIADAKRGDIGNTSSLYAKTFFEYLNFDAVTVAPYMGIDSVTPFLKKNKFVILLGLTSNKGSRDFQFTELKNGKRIFEEVIEVSKNWADNDQLMYVVGATNAQELRNIRKIVPDHFLLVPGFGAQGGSLEEVVENGMNKDCGLLVNSSRGIIYADNSEKFDEIARIKAKEIQIKMDQLLAANNI
tara:strand:- start:813 stop:1631 length:819 start_codon:yes stop_codon:yes gene_type:complete